MNKIGIFIGGFLAGILLTIASSYIFNSCSGNDDVDTEEIDQILEKLDALIVHPDDEPGEIINEESFEVFDVWDRSTALVHGKSDYGSYSGIVYVIVQDDVKNPYYDRQIIKVPKGKVVRMFGTHRYETNNGNYKTVPIIKIIDK